MARVPKKVLLLPGNHTPPDVVDVSGIAFYASLGRLLAEYGLTMPLGAFPDGWIGHEGVWKPFVVGVLGMDADTLIIGHSTGAVCAMRLMEEYDVAGCVLVAAYHTDLGDDEEKESGYFSRPWDYEAMKKHTPWVLQFHSENDQFVPLAEAEHVARQLGTEFHVTSHDEHYEQESSPIMEAALREKLESIGLTRSNAAQLCV
jgi:hypothetical protein